MFVGLGKNGRVSDIRVCIGLLIIFYGLILKGLSYTIELTSPLNRAFVVRSIAFQLTNLNFEYRRYSNSDQLFN